MSPTLPLALLLGLATAGATQEPAAPDYDAAIAPILKRYCAGCHNDGDREGEFSLESYASLQAGTEDGPALLAGDAANSRIIRLMTGAAAPRMPPKDKPKPSAEEIDRIRAWIDAGARGPSGEPPDRLRLIVPAIETRTRLQPITALEASRDGRRVAVGRYGRVTLHTIRADGSIDPEAPDRTLGPFTGKVTAAHFTADGSQLVTASGIAGLGGVASVWDANDGRLIREIRAHRDLIHDAELSPDGKLLATCGYDGKIELHDAATGAFVRRLDGHNAAVYDVGFSPDGLFLVSGSADDTCKIWRIADGVRMDTLPQPLKEIYSCAFSPDGRSVMASGADNNLRVWQFVARDKPDINPMVVARFAHEGPILRSAFTADGKRVVSLGADRTIKVWDTADYSELKAWADQPDVASTLAIAVDGASFLVGRLDGTLARFPMPAAGESPREAGGQVAAVAATAAGAEPVAVDEQEPNQTPGEARTITLPARIRGAIAGRPGDAPDVDLFRFAARAGEEWVVEIDAARSKSKLDSFIEILDERGHRIERARLQAIRDSYFTFRGKDDDSVDDFRLFNWEEMDLNSYLYANGEIVKFWLYPRGPDSGFMVYPGQGKRWGYFDTTPLAHALGEPAYVVVPHPPGSVLKPNGLPVIPLYYENDDEGRRTLGKDSRLVFTAPADGPYLLKIKDVRGYEGADFAYTATIRPRHPDFRVTVSGLDPVLAAGDAKEFRLGVQRLDDFDGPIRVEIADLPPGFHASSPIVIEEGQIEAHGVLWADATATAPTPEQAKAGKITATATIGDREVAHDIPRGGAIRWSDKPPVRVAILPAEGGARPVREPAEGPLEFAIRPGETIQLLVRADRGGYGGQFPFGKEGAGRNLPFGVYVDNVGLNGLLILEDQVERPFYVTADKAVPAQSRLFHLTTSAEGGHSSLPVLLHIRP